MENEEPTQKSVPEEFEEIGKNLLGILRAAWDSPERKRLSDELETGINELGQSLRREMENFEKSPTGERIKSNVDDIQQQIRTGEVEEKIRIEVLGALRTVNAELRNAKERLNTRKQSDSKSNDISQPEE